MLQEASSSRIDRCPGGFGSWYPSELPECRRTRGILGRERNAATDPGTVRQLSFHQHPVPQPREAPNRPNRVLNSLKIALTVVVDDPTRYGLRVLQDG